MGKLEGKIALVTGGNSGIGLATVHQLVADGAHVFLTGRRQEELDAVVKQLGKAVTAIQGDVSKPADLARLASTIKETKGRVDIVFANAGIAESAPLGSVTEDHFDRHFDINVKGALMTVQAVLPLLSKGASIIMTASVVASKGFAALSVYSATKASLRSFARTWTSELKDRKIRVNVVSPGTIDTPGLRTLNGNTDAAGLNAKFGPGIPLGEVGEASDIAKAVSFLASDDAKYITGSELFVDGGLAQV